MSRLEKMSIQGIRSFSPDSSEKIEFYIPVTLILGPNGTGKTTIIECLKYATTGELPPGSKVGGSFVHDPKLAQEVEVKAKVGVAIKDISGDNMIVTRSMLATQKAKTIQTRTLDGVIKRQMSDGQVKSISSKCADLDREVVSSLGVSKPVLESVIFCHQEESNWPLSEGKAVKQRFDDIFASTRYVKALEVIRKTKQEQDQNVKVFKESVKHVREQNAKAQELRSDLEEKKVGLAAEEDSLEKLNTKLTPLKEELTEYRSKYQELCNVQSETESLKREKWLIDETISRLRSNVKEEFVGSDEELRAAIDSVEQSVSSVEGKTRNLEMKLSSLKRDTNKAMGEVRSLGIEQGKRKQEQEDHEAVKRRWGEIIDEFSRVEGVAGPGMDASVDARIEFHQSMNTKLEENETESSKRKVEMEGKERAIQKDLDKQRAGISKLEQSKTMKRTQMGKHEAEAKRLRQRLGEAEASAKKLDKVKVELGSAEEKMKRLEGEDVSPMLKEEMEEGKKECKTLEAEVSRLEEKIDKMMEKSKQIAERKLLEKEKKEKETAMRKLRSKLTEDLEQVFRGEPPSDRLRAALERKVASLEEENRSSNERLTKLRSELTSARTEAKMMREELGRKRERLGKAEEKVQEVCGAVGYDEALRLCQEKKKKVEEEKAFLQGSLNTYSKFKERLGKEQACPLCHRGFDLETDVADLMEELERRLNTAPRELKSKEKESETVGKKFEALVRLRAVQEEQRSLSTSEIPTLERQVGGKTEDVGRLESKVEEAASVLEVDSADETLAKAIHGDVIVLERLENEVKATGEKVARLGGGGDDDGGESLEELQEKKKSKQQELREVAEGIEMRRERLDRAADRMLMERSKLNALREEWMRLERANQERSQLAADMGKVEEEAKRLKRELEEDEEGFAPLMRAIASLEEEKEKAVQDKEREMDKRRQRSMQLRDKLQQLKQHQDAVRRYESLGKEAKLQQLHRRMEDLDKSIAEKEKAASETSEALETLKSDVANQKIRKRELDDCLQIREKEVAIGRITAKLSGLAERMGSINITTVDRNLKKLQKEEEDLLKKRQLLIEQKTTLLGQMKMLEKELRTPLYKEAEERFRKAMHELKTTEVAASDLEKYYRALDRAIMSYHAFKMEEINKIIKELWRNTYKGNDIDFIEIRSDEDEAGLTRTRRTYNYRVVMVKSDTAMDMRGRCSAGQKVLASLIIRLALSEAFCLNCGVLALDEPTTNLDRENIESLAFALVEIIKTRSRQKNFQLIIITHDEDFVELLGRSEYVENFFRINRNSNGLSEIRKLSIDEEFH